MFQSNRPLQEDCCYPSSWIDSLIIQMQDRFSDEDRHAHHLLCLVQSIIVNKALQLDRIKVKVALFWEKDISFLKSLGNEVRRWKTLWQSTDRELPNSPFISTDEGAFPNIYRFLVVTCPLRITSGEAELSFSLMKWIKTCSRSMQCNLVGLWKICFCWFIPNCARNHAITYTCCYCFSLRCDLGFVDVVIN